MNFLKLSFACILLLFVSSCGQGCIEQIHFTNNVVKNIALPKSLVISEIAYVSSSYYYLKVMNKETNETAVIAISKSKHRIKRLPELPQMSDNIFISPRFDLFSIMVDNKSYTFDERKWSWINSNDTGHIIFSDSEWTAQNCSQGEYGNAIWFTNNHDKREYVFNGLEGIIRSVDNEYYVINQTRIYKFRDPCIGFECDSTTYFESTIKKVTQAKCLFHISRYLWDKGAGKEQWIAPIVCFDEELTTMKDGGIIKTLPYTVSDYCKSIVDTTLVNSFSSSHKLFCLLKYRDLLFLSKLEENCLVKVNTLYDSRIIGDGKVSKEGNTLSILLSRDENSCLLTELSCSGRKSYILECK